MNEDERDGECDSPFSPDGCHSWKYIGQNEHATYFKCRWCGEETEG